MSLSVTDLNLNTYDVNVTNAAHKTPNYCDIQILCVNAGDWLDEIFHHSAHGETSIIHQHFSLSS